MREREMLGEMRLVVNYGWVKVVVGVEERYEEENAIVVMCCVVFNSAFCMQVRFQCLWRARLRVSAHGCFLRRSIPYISPSHITSLFIFYH